MAISEGGYKAALDFIMRRELFGIKLGLDNITRFLDRLDHPQDKFRSVHIAGTNGKGSTAAYIESILRQAGYKTGIFTSPHLTDYRERIRVDGKQISRKYIIDFVSKYHSIISRQKITFFETCTALAFCYFADCKVDIAIVEVGLGGRLDATNTLVPVLSVITDISLDHTNILGDSLIKIAFEKAGIVKPGVPVLAGIMPGEPRKEIARVCREKRAPFIYLSKKDFPHNGNNAKGNSLFNFDYCHDGLILNRICSGLYGNHQIANSALSIRAVDLLKRVNFPVRKKDIRSGLKNVYWPGRFEIIKTKGKPTIIMDVGHNPSGIRAMVRCFKRLFPGQKADLVMGFVRNKKLDESVRYLESIAGRVEIVRLKTQRSADPDEIASYFKNSRLLNVSQSVIDSARKLIDLAGPDDKIIICGSHYAVGELKPVIKKIL